MPFKSLTDQHWIFSNNVDKKLQFSSTCQKEMDGKEGLRYEDRAIE